MATKRYGAGPRHSITSPVKVYSMHPSSEMCPCAGDTAPHRTCVCQSRHDAHSHAAERAHRATMPLCVTEFRRWVVDESAPHHDVGLLILDRFPCLKTPSRLKPQRSATRPHH